MALNHTNEPTEVAARTINSFALRGRLQRAKRLVQETRMQRGEIAAVALVGRMVWRKVPLLIQNVRAAGRTAKVRSALARVREQNAAVQPAPPVLACVVSGGLGDCLVIARFLRDFIDRVGPLYLDIFSPTPGLAAWAFGNLPGFHAAYHDISFERMLGDYDAGLRLNQMAVVYGEFIRWPVVRENRALSQVLRNLIQFRPKIEPFVERHPWMDNYLGRFAVFSGATRRDFLHQMAGLRYGGDTLPVPQDVTAVARNGLHPGGYITVHNGFDSGFMISGRRATKCYPHFGAVVTRLKRAMPQMRFVQLGTVTSQPIHECDLILLDKTSLDDSAALIANAALHLDNESGLVHLAACVGTRSAVVFGPTPSDYFGYPDNIAVDPPVCGNCWWMTRTWMDACAKGFETPRCMMEQDPEVVAAKVLQELDGRQDLARLGQAVPVEA